MTRAMEDDEDEMLEYCSCNCTGELVDYVDDLIAFKAKFGYLTQKQRDSVAKIYYVQRAKDEKQQR